MGRPEPLPDERAIVERAIQGDKRAFEKLYRAYATVLFSYVLVPVSYTHLTLPTSTEV